MQRPSPFTSLLIVALVAVDILGLYYVIQVKNEIAQLQAAASYQDGLRNEIGQLRSAISAMQKGQEWISPIEISVGGSSKDAISILATWQVVDFTEGSSVTLYWQGPEDDGFREIAADRLGGGRFEARVEEPATIMPEVTVFSGSAVDGKASKVQEKPVMENPMSCTYFVSVKTGDVVKSADAVTVDLSKLSTALTYGLGLYVGGDSKKTTTSLREVPTAHAKPAFRLESASLEGYSGTSKVIDLPLLRTGITTESVGSESVDTPVFMAETPKPVPALSGLWLNLTYSGGETARVELAPSILE